MPCAKLLEYLTDNNVEFELKNHPNAYAAQDVAFKSGVPGRLFAKTVMVKLDGKMAMAVLPADSKVDFHLLQGNRRRRNHHPGGRGRVRGNCSPTANWGPCRRSDICTAWRCSWRAA